MLFCVVKYIYTSVLCYMYLLRHLYSGCASVYIEVPKYSLLNNYSMRPLCVGILEFIF